jgi:hypothetical protein
MNIFGWLLIISSSNGHWTHIVSVAQMSSQKQCELAKTIVEKENYAAVSTKCVEMRDAK